MNRIAQINFFLFFLLQMPLQSVLYGQPERAFGYYDQCIERWSARGRTDSALFYLRAKISAARTADSLEIWAWTQLDVQDMLQPNSEQSQSALTNALKECWRQPVTTAEWEAFLYLYANRGRHLFLMGRVWESIQVYRTADAIFEKYHFPDFDATEYLYKPLGNHLTRLGDNEKALLIFQKALALNLEHENDPASLAGIYNNIGVAQWNNGDYRASERTLRQGLALPQIGAEKKALLLGALAQTTLDQGHAAAALNLAKEGLLWMSKTGLATATDGANRRYPARIPSAEMAEKLAHRSRLYATTGTALMHLNRPDEAARQLGAALKDAEAAYGTAHHRDVGKIEVTIAAVWLQKKAPDMALAAANRALVTVLPGFKVQQENPEANPAASDLYAENTIAEALQQKGRAAQLSFAQTGIVHWAESALESYDLAARVYQILRETFFYPSSKLNLLQTARSCDEEALNIARILFEKTGDIRWAKRAVYIAERHKASVLFETLRDNVVLQKKSVMDARFEQTDRLRQNIGWLEREILLQADPQKNDALRLEADALREQVRQLEQELRRAYPVLFQHGSDQINFAEILPSGTAFLLCFEGATILHLFFGDDKGVAEWRTLRLDTFLRSDLLAFRLLLSDEQAIAAQPTVFFEAAHRLYNLIFSAIDLPETSLLIIPDGILAMIPMESLLTKGPTPDMKLRTAPYLIRHCPVRYAWSLAVLQYQQQLPASHSNRLLGVAPGFHNGQRGLAPLGTGKEEWDAWQRADALTGAAATRAAFLQAANQYTMLHLATHANAGQRPGIELWDETLLLPDIYALTLQVELVALSACETNAGTDIKGEGNMSLARAFACAGTKSLLATNWKADDEATKTLFKAFYHYLSQGMSKSKALQQAKLDYLDGAANASLCLPRFWAALTLNGDDGPIRPSDNHIWWWLGIGVIVLFVGRIVCTRIMARK